MCNHTELRRFELLETPVEVAAAGCPVSAAAGAFTCGGLMCGLTYDSHVSVKCSGDIFRGIIVHFRLHTGLLCSGAVLSPAYSE